MKILTNIPFVSVWHLTSVKAEVRAGDDDLHHIWGTSRLIARSAALISSDDKEIRILSKSAAFTSSPEYAKNHFRRTKSDKQKPSPDKQKSNDAEIEARWDQIIAVSQGRSSYV